MLIRDLGEFGLIKRIKKSIKTDSSVIKGIGDDCAVLEFTQDKYQLFSCDTLIEGVDFAPFEKPYLIGRKSLAVSISDIASCGGLPHYSLISLGLPQKTSLEFIDKFFRGMLELARQYKINIVGGDLSKTKILTITVTILGTVEKRYLVLRSQAKIGDLIFVTGKLGGSIQGKHLRFSPRIREARFLVKNFKINSMIDISDSLTQDLSHILEESRVGAVIYEDLIPLSREARDLNDALYMGEDFELIFTLSASWAKKLQKIKKNDFIPIGEIVDKKYGIRLVDKNARAKIIRPKGFRHF